MMIIQNHQSCTMHRMDKHQHTSINTQSTKNAFSIINLWHYTLFILFPFFRNLYHFYSFCNTFTCYCTELTSSTFLMEKNMSSSTPCDSYSSLWVKLVSISNKL